MESENIQQFSGEKWDHYLSSVTAKKNGAEETQVYGMRHISALKLVPNKVIGAIFSLNVPTNMQWDVIG